MTADLRDLLAERYGQIPPSLDQALGDLIDAGNRLANIVDGPARKSAPVRAALARWDHARDRFPEIDP